MARVEWTDNGRESLLSIGRFIAEQNQNIERALQVIDRVEEKCRLIATLPASGMLRPDLAPDLRSTLVDNLVIIYRPLDDGMRILLVAHGHEDLPTVLTKLWPT